MPPAYPSLQSCAELPDLCNKPRLVYKHAISTIAPIDGEGVQPDQEKRNAAKPNVVVPTKPSRRLA